MDHRVAEGLEDGAAAVDVLGVAAGHDEELALGGRRAAAADRRVDDGDAAPGSLLGQAPAGVGVDRGVDGHDAAGRHAGQDAVGPQDHVLDVGVGHDADPHHVARRPQLGRRRRRDRGRVAERLEGLGAAGPEGERVAPLDDAPGHRPALAPDPDEPDPAHRPTSPSRDR